MFSFLRDYRPFDVEFVPLGFIRHGRRAVTQICYARRVIQVSLLYPVERRGAEFRRAQLIACRRELRAVSRALRRLNEQEVNLPASPAPALRYPQPDLSELPVLAESHALAG